MMSLSPQKLLSAASKEQCLSKLKDVPVLVKGDNMQTNLQNNAAVLVPLCVVDGEVCILYTLRSSNLKAHGGQVSFPGGKRDGNETAVETALRETEEEIGLPSRDVDVWGEMSIVQGRNANVLIAPVVGVINDFNINTLKINADEVEEVFTVPLASLCDVQNHGHIESIPFLPVFVHGKHKIWGITGFITKTFLNCFVPDFKMNFHHQKFSINDLMPSKL